MKGAVKDYAKMFDLKGWCFAHSQRLYVGIGSFDADVRAESNEP